MLLHSRTRRANRLPRLVVLAVATLVLVTNVFGGQQVWNTLWKTALFALFVAVFAILYCVWRENKTSTHQRYG